MISSKGVAPRLLVTCANLHAGGGVAVATSFLHALSGMREAKQVTVLASSEVHENLCELSTPLESFGEYLEFNQFGISALWQRKPLKYADFDVVFTVFGPQYSVPVRARAVTGLAQPWVVYPENAAYGLLPSRRQRVSTRIRYEIQALFFSFSDVLVVEQEHVRTGLRKRRLFRDTPIVTVPSAVDSVHFDKSRWEPLVLPDSTAALKLGIIARNYPHKNLRVLPEVKDLLKSEHGLDTDIFVTLPKVEWDGLPESFTKKIKNAGPLTLAQCPSFYEQMDGVIFPSLLECFSATPIEALAARKPLFASDLPFVRDTVGGHAYYFDPQDPRGIASTVASYFGAGAKQECAESDSGFLHVTESSTAEERATAYLAVCGLASSGEDEDGSPLHPAPNGRQA